MGKVCSNVRVQGFEAAVSVPVTSPEKPEIRSDVCEKWQKIIDVMAGCFDVPAGLIMQLDKERITVFLSSRTGGNPYAENDSESLLHGLYCETVVGQDRLLLVPDAREDSLWCHNPDIKLGMVSYLGYPIKWPDGEVFGTICVLDKKKNEYSEKFIELMQILKDTIEEDLAQLIDNYNELKGAYERLTQNMRALKKSKEDLQNSLQEKNILLSEIHHRVKNNLQIISSLVDLQSLTSLDENISSNLSNIRNRILAMGILHEILYKSKDFKNIEIKDYVELLVHNLKNLLAGNSTKHEINIDIDENLIFNLDTSIPVGLIVNEIVTNSFKHAFPGNKKGKISIKMYECSAEDFTINISDNGCGISNSNPNNPDGLGLELVNSLVYQLNGKMDVKSEKGTSYSITLHKVVKEEKRWSKES
jgi:two-component sensor histidine kinase